MILFDRLWRAPREWYARWIPLVASGWTPRLDSDWTPESSRYPPAGSSQATDFTTVSGDPGWTPTGVDSQKNRSDAGEVARCAPQHTFRPGKEPENNGLAVCLRPARRALAPKKNRLRTGFGERSPRACGGHLPLANPCPRTRPDPHRRSAGFLSGLWPGPRKPPSVSTRNAKGRACPPAHSPHHAFQVARSCCRCRRKKCCNTLESFTHSVARRSWSAPAASAARQSCGRSPARR